MVALYLKAKLHDQARTINANVHETPESITCTNFTILIESTEPILLQFLTTMTQSVQQGKRKLFQDTSLEVNTKNIRLFYGLCVLQFCTSNTCTAPMHTALTEAVCVMAEHLS